MGLQKRGGKIGGVPGICRNGHKNATQAFYETADGPGTIGQIAAVPGIFSALTIQPLQSTKHRRLNNHSWAIRAVGREIPVSSSTITINVRVEPEWCSRAFRLSALGAKEVGLAVAVEVEAHDC